MIIVSPVIEIVQLLTTYSLSDIMDFLVGFAAVAYAVYSTYSKVRRIYMVVNAIEYALIVVVPRFKREYRELWAPMSSEFSLRQEVLEFFKPFSGVLKRYKKDVKFARLQAKYRAESVFYSD